MQVNENITQQQISDGISCQTKLTVLFVKMIGFIEKINTVNMSGSQKNKGPDSL